MEWFSTIILVLISVQITQQVDYDCDDLLMGQYLCPDPTKKQIDPKTQQFYGCTKENKARGKSK